MKWNIGSTTSSSSASTLGMPAGHPAIPSTSQSGANGNTPPAGCPMHNSSPSIAPVIPKAKAAECPIPHDQRALHPLNRIPLGLSATEKAPGQVLDLPTEREVSSIPRPQNAQPSEGDEIYPEDVHNGKWEYPSPQQFYNALVRKGWETPEESIEMVVAIHNFLNERAWEEVMAWERRLPGGEHAQLARFEGKPGELSPKARMHLWAGKVFPSMFNTEPPFDRHDWIVTRPDPNGSDEQVNPTAAAAYVNSITQTQSQAQSSSSSSTPTTPAPSPFAASTRTSTTRYVIDYYDAGKDEEGMPVFSLDVRPALDSFQSVSERIRVGVEEYMRGTSGSA